MLWVDKHRPKKLDELDYHKPLSSQLKRMVGGGDFPHMLLYGPSGAGKKTRLMALLREMFGSSVERLRVEQRTFKVGASATPVDLTLVCSSHHIELNPSDAGTRDRDVVQEVIKEIAQSASVVAGAGPAFKVVVLNEVERMSKPAQHALRRTMEKCAPRAIRRAIRRAAARKSRARNSLSGPPFLSQVHGDVPAAPRVHQPVQGDRPDPLALPLPPRRRAHRRGGVVRAPRGRAQGGRQVPARPRRADRARVGPQPAPRRPHPRGVQGASRDRHEARVP